MALIKCSECGKEISDKSKICIHCGCPIEPKLYCEECGKEIHKKDKVCKNCGGPISKKHNKSIDLKGMIKDKNFKTKNKTAAKLDEKTLKNMNIIFSLILSIIMFFLMFELTFDNFFISIIVSIIYCVLLFISYKYLVKKMNTLKTLFKLLAVGGMLTPLVIVICLMVNTEYWSYNNYRSYYSDMEYYSLSLNVFGKCYYYYNNLEKDITKKSSKCLYEKNDDKYTFYITDKETQEENSFDCRVSNGELKCPLKYTYPTRYIYLQKG